MIHQQINIDQPQITLALCGLEVKCRWSLHTAVEEGVRASWLIIGPKRQVSSCVKIYTNRRPEGFC